MLSATSVSESELRNSRQYISTSKNAHSDWFNNKSRLKEKYGNLHAGKRLKSRISALLTLDLKLEFNSYI